MVTFFTDAGTPSVEDATSQEGFLALIQNTVHISRKLEAHGYITTPNRNPRTPGVVGWNASMVRVGWLPEMPPQPLIHCPHRAFCLLYIRGSRRDMRCRDSSSEMAEAVSHYEAIIAHVYTHFLRDRRRYYNHEPRWPEVRFGRPEGVANDRAVP